MVMLQNSYVYFNFQVTQIFIYKIHTHDGQEWTFIRFIYDIHLLYLNNCGLMFSIDIQLFILTDSYSSMVN